jgi:hypothetical protein
MPHQGLLLLALVAHLAGPGPSDRLMAWGRDPSRGVLVNLTVGSGPADPVDPRRPTVVVVHGLNPFSTVLRFEMAERYAEEIGRAWGPSVTVLAWDWNAAATPRLRPGAGIREALDQGAALAGALLGTGLDPARMHLIGQSSGSVIVAAAARGLAGATGRPVDRLTLLDPVGAQHEVIFGQLAAATAALRVEHIWATGPSGFGRASGYPGVIERSLDGPGGAFGLLRPMHTDHFYAVRWHIGRLRIEEPAPAFETSESRPRWERR